MTRVLLVAVFFLASLAVANSTYAPKLLADEIPNPAEPNEGASQTSEWGAEVNGLRLRATLAETVEENTKLEIVIEFQSNPATLPSGMRALNPCRDRCTNVSVLLMSADSDRTIELPGITRVYGPPGMNDDGRLALPLDGKPIKELHESADLFRSSPKCTAGKYKCIVRFEQKADPNPNWRLGKEAWDAEGYWSGRIESATVDLEIVPEVSRTQTFLAPKRLRIVRSNQWQIIRSLLTGFTAEDAVEVTVPIRNGHGIMTRVDKQDGALGLRGGPPKPDDPNGFDRWLRYEGGDISTTYHITVFETCDRESRVPGPGSCGYKVLWEREFKLEVPEEEVNKLLGN